MKYIKLYEAYQMYKPDPNIKFMCGLIKRNDNEYDNYIISFLNRGFGKDRLDDINNILYDNNHKPGKDGETLLMKAAIYDNIGVVKDLLRSDNIDINITGIYNHSALMTAALSRNTDIMDILLERPEIDVYKKNTYKQWESGYNYDFLDFYITRALEPRKWLTYDKQKQLLQKWPNLYDTLKKYPNVIDPKIVEEYKHLKNELF